MGLTKHRRLLSSIFVLFVMVGSGSNQDPKANMTTPVRLTLSPEVVELANDTTQQEVNITCQASLQVNVRRLTLARQQSENDSKILLAEVDPGKLGWDQPRVLHALNDTTISSTEQERAMTFVFQKVTCSDNGRYFCEVEYNDTQQEVQAVSDNKTLTIRVNMDESTGRQEEGNPDKLVCTTMLGTLNEGEQAVVVWEYRSRKNEATTSPWRRVQDCDKWTIITTGQINHDTTINTIGQINHDTTINTIGPINHDTTINTTEPINHDTTINTIGRIHHDTGPINHDTTINTTGPINHDTTEPVNNDTTIITTGPVKNDIVPCLYTLTSEMTVWSNDSDCPSAYRCYVVKSGGSLAENRTNVERAATFEINPEPNQTETEWMQETFPDHQCFLDGVTMSACNVLSEEDMKGRPTDPQAGHAMTPLYIAVIVICSGAFILIWCFLSLKERRHTDTEPKSNVLKGRMLDQFLRKHYHRKPGTFKEVVHPAVYELDPQTGDMVKVERKSKVCISRARAFAGFDSNRPTKRSLRESSTGVALTRLSSDAVGLSEADSAHAFNTADDITSEHSSAVDDPTVFGTKKAKPKSTTRLWRPGMSLGPTFQSRWLRRWRPDYHPGGSQSYPDQSQRLENNYSNQSQWSLQRGAYQPKWSQSYPKQSLWSHSYSHQPQLSKNYNHQPQFSQNYNHQPQFSYSYRHQPPEWSQSYSHLPQWSQSYSYQPQWSQNYSYQPQWSQNYSYQPQWSQSHYIQPQWSQSHYIQPQWSPTYQSQWAQSGGSTRRVSSTVS